jgi:protein TonB
MKKILLIVSLLAIVGISPVIAATEPPVPIRTVDPVYPTQLRQDKVNGIVMVNFLVDDHGVVQDPKVLKASNADFAQPALDAVKLWKFKPAERDGNIVAVRVTIPIRFSLDS